MKAVLTGILVFAGLFLAVLTPAVRGEVVFEDNFEDGTIDANLWVVGGTSRGWKYNDPTPTGSWLWSTTEIQSTDGFLQLRVSGPASGNTFGAEAWMRTAYDFHDGRNYIVNFTCEGQVGGHYDLYYIQVTDGFIPPFGSVHWPWLPHETTDPAQIVEGTTNLLGPIDPSTGELVGAPNGALGPKRTWSLEIDASGEARLYDGPDGTGSLVQEQSLKSNKPWHVRLMLISATSSGYGAGDASLLAYSFRAETVEDPRVVAADDAYSVDEDGTLDVAAPGVLANDTAADGDPLTAVWVSDPANGTLLFAGDGSFDYIPHADFNGTDSFTYKANDGELDSNVATVTITVNPVNDPPVLGDITAPLDPVPVGTSINVSASFTDPDVGDTHAAVWDWGDLSSDTEDPATSPLSGSHIYSSPGIHAVKLTVTDAAGASDEAVFEYVVVYDPEGGFVTGGGWINSPPGAYAPDPTLTGKATFGFVSKYKKGADVPVGRTEFQFRVADLNFHSTSYQWLVVAGPQAKFKGSGTINGEGDYGFMLTARDGQMPGGGGVDRFRIKIWEGDDVIVYDNQMGEADDSEAVTEIGGGNIVIHKEKK